MTIVYTRQLRPVTNTEDNESDGISSRVFRDHCGNPNVLKGRAGVRFVGAIHRLPAIAGVHAQPGEYQLLGWHYAHVRTGHTQLHFDVWTKKTAVGDDVILVGWLDQVPYLGNDAPFDIAALSSAAETDTTTVTTVTYAWHTLDIDVVSKQDQRMIIYLSYKVPAIANTLDFGYCSIEKKELT